MSFKVQVDDKITNGTNVFVKSKKKQQQTHNGKKKKKVKPIVRKPDIPKPKGIGYISFAQLCSLKFDYSKDKYINPSTKPILSIQFIGHVDAGKSTLCGHLARFLSPSLKSELANNSNNANSKLSHYFDSFPEEQLLGKTQEPVYECFELQTRRIVVIDNPGHKGFVPRVLQYSQAADLVCLIISTKMNEFESGFEKEGQTREHVLGAIGVQSGQSGVIIVANKMDVHSWNQDTYSEITNKIKDWMQKDINITPQLCPVSALNGTNLLHRNQVPQWYKGESLVQILESVPLPVRNNDAFLRIPVVDVLKDQGVFVFGKVESGILVINQDLLVMPYKTLINIAKIYNSQYQSVPYALPGEYVKIKIKNANENELKQGFIICNIEDYCHVAYEIEAELKITDLPEHKPIISGGYKCILHIHTIVEEIEIKTVISYKNSENQFVPQSFLRTGMTGKVRIISQQYLCLEKFETNPYLGSFALRDEAKTIGFGKILRLKPATKLPTIQEIQPEEIHKNKVIEEEAKLESIQEEDEGY